MSEPRDPVGPDPSPDLPPPGGDTAAGETPFEPPTGADPSPPTEPLPTTPGGDPTPPAAPLPPTEAVPTTAPGATAGAAGAAGAAATGPGAPPPPPGGDTAVGFDDERPWWKSPVGIASILIGVLLAAALLAWLIWGGGDDDDAEPEPGIVRLELTAVDPSGAGLDRAFIGTVAGPPDAPADFTWILPSGGDGTERGGETDADGVITFAWEPNDTVAEPAAWESRITVVGNSPAGATPPGPTIDCVLERTDEQPSTISMSAVADPPDVAVDQLVTFTFPNHVFLPGDLVTCELVSVPPPSTTTSTTTTTVPETTTTEATTTTVAETTTVAPTTAAPTTAAPTTAAPTTAAPTTTAPAQPATAREALDDDGNFTTFLSLVDQAPAAADLIDGDGPITVFAPTDDALQGITPPTGDELEALLLAHIVDGEALDAATLLDGRTEVTMADGTVHEIDDANQTIGGIPISIVDLLSDNGVSHGIDSVLAPDAP